MWTDRATTLVPRAGLWTDPSVGRRAGKTAGMSIEVPVLEVLGLADRLRAAALHGADAAARLGSPGGAGGVGAALEDFLACFALAARAVGAETELLGEAATAAAYSWVALDADLLARRGQLTSR